MKRLLTAILLSSLLLPTHAQEKKRTFWDHGVGKYLKKADDLVASWQEEGVDTNYIRKQELDRMVYVGFYGYFQQHDMTFPVLVRTEDVPYNSKYRPSNMDEYSYLKANMHTYQCEFEIGIDWRGIAIEIPIPVRNKYSMSIGLAKTGSVWGARVRYKAINRMRGVLEDAYNQSLDQWKENNDNKVSTPVDVQEKRIEAGDIDLKIFYAEGYYVFNNKKFSLAAAAYGDMVQRRSAGSLFVMANYYQSRFGANGLFNFDRDTFRNWKVSIGPGYGYNWSLMQGRMCLHMSFIPMISLWNSLVHKSQDNTTSYSYAATSTDPNVNATLIEIEKAKWAQYDEHYYDAVDNGRSRFVFNMFGRMALSYSWDRYLLNVLMNYRQYMYRNHADMKINNRELDAQINIGIRF